MRVVDSVPVRLEETKDVGVLERHIGRRVPVEVIGMLGQRVEGRLANCLGRYRPARAAVAGSASSATTKSGPG